MALASASPHAALACFTSRPRYFTPSRGPKPRCLKFHPKYPAYPNSSSMLQGANHASRVRNGATSGSELADASCDSGCEMWIRELQAEKRGPWCCLSAHDTPVYLSVYDTNGELANLHRQTLTSVSGMGFRRPRIARLGPEKEVCRFAACARNFINNATSEAERMSNTMIRTISLQPNIMVFARQVLYEIQSTQYQCINVCA